MILFKYPYKYLFLALAIMVGIISCVRDDIEMPEDPSSPDVTVDGYNLSFNINLQSLQTRDGSLLGDNFEDYEDYIDVSKTFILFFTAEDKLIKKFSYKDLSLLPVRNSNDESAKQWVVRIPISKMEDGEAFAAQLRDEPFKIAVLANWGKDPSIEVGDDLDLLHHQSDANDPYCKENIYHFLYSGKTDKGYMGFSTDWVKNTKFKTKEDARDYIREGWNPALSENLDKAQYGDYKDLWFLWNFGGADKIENESDANSSNAIKYCSFAKEWEERNGRHLREWVTGKESTDPDENYDPEQPIRSLNAHYGSDEKDINYLAFKTVEGAKAVKTPGEKPEEFYYGVNLPAIEPKGGKVGNYTRMNPENEEGFFSFMARATGTLFITAKNTGSGKARLTAQVGYTGTKVDFEIPYEDGKIQTIEKKIPITGNEDWVYIFNRGKNDGSKNLAPNDVVIYQIEFIQDEYLYSTDRKGITPSEIQPIEMYGIQSFDALGEYWQTGTSFDLSNFNKSGLTGYRYNSVMLLRSVAKVELMVPTSYDPSYVYLRSVNRKARWEPVDISSDTSDIWEDLGSTSAHPKNCEWFSIRGQEPFYKPDSNNTPQQQVENYKKKLAWYYGSWADDRSLGGVTVPEKNDYWSEHYENKTERDYPHIMNALIERSDFVEFIEAPSQEPGYKRFVLYVGEKYVDDPNDVGENEEMETSKPKVCHIEFRKGKTYNTNFDDNHCIRIYFIEGGVKSGFTIPTFEKNENGEDDDWEHKYEQNVEMLKEHWPIMRNHVYSFKVMDSGSLMPLVDLKVIPWRMVEGQNSYDW